MGKNKNSLRGGGYLLWMLFCLMTFRHWIIFYTACAIHCLPPFAFCNFSLHTLVPFEPSQISILGDDLVVLFGDVVGSVVSEFALVCHTEKN